MYVTRRLSHLQTSLETVQAPPDGPNSGYLVIQDKEYETSKEKCLHRLPFPQNQELTIKYITYAVENIETYLNPLFLIPVLNHPLSSNRYYAIDPHRGVAVSCSREEDKITCCFCRCINDVQPRRLDPSDMYQQFEIVRNNADSIASDGFPPFFLRRQGWTIDSATVEHCKLDTAEGVDSKIRSQLPEFDFFLPQKISESSTVGKWYCPFMFVKEGTLADQVKKSMYYEITLEQRWEQIFTCNRNSNLNRENAVAINALIEKEEAFINGIKAVWNEKEGVVWFSTGVGGDAKSVGLRVETVQRMKWEEERFGYISGEETQRQVKIDKMEEHHGNGEWSEFGSYVLVERFNLRRMDGSLVMCYDFKHLDKMKSKWQ